MFPMHKWSHESPAKRLSKAELKRRAASAILTERSLRKYPAGDFKRDFNPNRLGPTYKKFESDGPDIPEYKLYEQERESIFASMKKQAFLPRG